MPVAVGRYVCVNRTPPINAELALTVEDAYQGLGIGTLLMKHLISIATKNEIQSLEAEVMSENRRMLKILFNCGLPISTSVSEGETHISLSLNKQ